MPCRTHQTPLGVPIAPGALPRVAGVAEASYRPLAERYGTLASDVLALARDRPGLAEPVVAGLPDLLAEVAYAARHEQVRGIGDVLLRRTRLGVLAAREVTARGPEAPLERVADVLAGELGWDAPRREREIVRFAAESLAEGIVPEAVLA